MEIGRRRAATDLEQKGVLVAERDRAAALHHSRRVPRTRAGELPPVMCTKMRPLRLMEDM